MEYGTERTAAGASAAADGSGVTGGADGLAPEFLLPRLQRIEDRPLDQRAVALAELHDDLRARLEGGDAAAARG